MIANRKLNQILKSIDGYRFTAKFTINVQGLLDLLSPKFVSVYDCIIISDKSADILETNFSKMISMYGDRTGYEASNTEVRINDFIENGDLDVYDLVSIALLAIQCWSAKIKYVDDSSKFCFILSCDEQYVTLRFHKVRAEEGVWLSRDIEKYDDAVGYEYI